MGKAENNIRNILDIINALKKGVKVSKKTSLFGALKFVSIITGLLALNYDSDPFTVFKVEAAVYAVLDLLQGILTRDVDKSSEEHSAPTVTVRLPTLNPDK